MMLLAQIVSPDTISYGTAFLKMMGAMVVIIGFAFVFIRFILPRLSHIRRKSSSVIQVLDRQPLEPRKSIYLLQIGDKKIAVGVADNGISKLCEWNHEET